MSSFDENELKIYPNPVRAVLKIETTTDVLKTIDVYDISGKIMLKDASNQRVIELNTSKLPNGIYFVKVTTDAKSGYFKVVKE